MRFRDPVAAGRAGALARFEKYKREPVRRPEAGTVLRTITVEDHVEGCSRRMVVRQARRKNQVVVECFGRIGVPVGWDRIMRKLRSVCVVRWLEM